MLFFIRLPLDSASYVFLQDFEHKQLLIATFIELSGLFNFVTQFPLCIQRMENKSSSTHIPTHIHTLIPTHIPPSPTYRIPRPETCCNVFS